MTTRKWMQLSAIALDAAGAEKTPEGYLVVPATLARVGVLEYRTDEGRSIRVLRSEKSVFGSMDRLGLIPVTALHPRHNTGEAIPATSANFRAVNVGHVLGGSQRREGDYLRAKLVIQDAATVAAIERRELREVSMGYHRTLEMTPGNHPSHGAYDAVDAEATYNHVAIVPVGRAGRDVRLEIDAGDAFLEGWQTEATPPASGGAGAPLMKTEIINGKSYEVGSDAHREALIADAARQAKVTADAAEQATKLAQVTAERDQLKGKVDALTLQVDELSKCDVDAMVRERAEVLTAAAAAGVTVDDKMDNAAVRRAIVAKRFPSITLAADASDDYVRGILATTTSATGTKVVVDATGVTTVTTPPVTDAAPKDGYSDARRNQINGLEGRKEKS